MSLPLEAKDRPALEGSHVVDRSAESGRVVKKSQSQQALQDVVFGSIAGIVGKYIEYPFDTVKVRLQSQPAGRPPLYSGPFDCFSQSIRRHGFWSLYRGISAPLFGAAVETSSLFFSYRLAQGALRSTFYRESEVLPLDALIICGATSGAFTSLLLTPIELIKCKMQVPLQHGSTTIHAPGPLTLIASVFRHQGLLGFWRGQLGTLIRETGGSAAWFGSFEGVSLAFRKLRPPGTEEKPLPIHQQLLAGATAGMTYNFVFYPADTVKSRMQTEDVSLSVGKGGQNTFWNIGKALWREQGLKGMYRGCGITVARAAPSSAFIFTIYEGLKNAFG